LFSSSWEEKEKVESYALSKERRVALWDRMVREKNLCSNATCLLNNFTAPNSHNTLCAVVSEKIKSERAKGM